MIDQQGYERLKQVAAQEMPQGAAQPAAQGPQRAAVQTPSQQQLSYDQVQTEIQSMMQNNPQMAEQLKQEMMALMQSGELTADELNKMVQLAKAALQQPALYPQIRAFAIQQGIGTEQDIPQQYDQGLLVAVVIAGQTMQGAEPQPGAQGGAPMPSMKEGGALPAKSNNRDGSIPINAHEGEYVVPAEVVRHYGTKFFEDLQMKMEKRSVESGTSNT
jgi:hypothetical protein